MLDKRRLGELIDLISGIGLGGRENHARDLLGRVYEYFLGQFAGKEGKKAGEFYTPRHIVRLLVEMIEPYRGRVYDPCCGSSGMFVQSEEFIRAHGGRLGDISIFGQESNPTTWRLAKMNLAIRGIEANLGDRAADTFHGDLHPDLKADFILANPPFNMSDWGGDRLREDVRWRYGVPPVGNANFAWMQHMTYHLAPTGMMVLSSPTDPWRRKHPVRGKFGGASSTPILSTAWSRFRGSCSTGLRSLRACGSSRGTSQEKQREEAMPFVTVVVRCSS